MKVFQRIFSLALVMLLAIGGGVFLSGCKDKQSKSDLFSSTYELGTLSIRFDGAIFLQDTDMLKISIATINNGDVSMDINANSFIVKIINDNEREEYNHVYFENNKITTSSAGTITVAGNSQDVSTLSVKLYKRGNISVDDLSSNIRFEVMYLSHTLARFKPTLL